MSEYGKKINETTVRFERLLPGPIERVWDYLTDSKKRALWFAGGVTEEKAGGRVEFHFDHRRITSPDDKPPEKYKDCAGPMSFEGRVVKAERPSLLVWEWPDGEAWSEVTFALEKRGDRVLLTLTETRLPNRERLINNSGGWHKHLDLLDAKLSGKAPPPFWARLEELEEHYAKAFAER